MPLRAVVFDLFDTLVDLHMDGLPLVTMNGRTFPSTAGALHACLAYDDAVDLRGPLHAGGPAAVAGAIRGALAGKRPGHTFQLIGLGGPRKAMVQIGG